MARTRSPASPTPPPLAGEAFDLFTLPTATALAVVRGGCLVRLDQLPAGGQPRTPPAGAQRDPEAAPLPALRRQLAEYFAGHRRDFDLPLAAAGSEFERRVWRELVEIPFGETRSYAEIAAAIGRPAACRAVGRANGRNPISIVIPCHRVIGTDGSLTGYGGGLPIKRFLLQLEGIEIREERSGASERRRKQDRHQLALPLPRSFGK